MEKNKKVFTTFWGKAKTWAKNTFGASSSVTVTTTTYTRKYLPDPMPVTIESGAYSKAYVSKKGDSSKTVSVYANKESTAPFKSSTAGIVVNDGNCALDLCLGLDDFSLEGSYSGEDLTSSLALKINVSELKIGVEWATTEQWDNGMGTNTTYTNVSVSGWFLVWVYYYANSGQSLPSPEYVYSY